MSQAQLEKFISYVSGNPVAWEEASKGENDARRFAANIAEYARAKGYDFSEEEAIAWLADCARNRAGGELADAQLDAVAGGAEPINDLRLPTFNFAEPVGAQPTGASPQLGSFSLKMGYKVELK